MAIVKLAEGTYSRPQDVIMAIEYIGNLKKCNHMIEGGRNIIDSITGNPYSIAEQFLTIQHGQRFNRRMYHLIISFEGLPEGFSLKFVYDVGQTVADMYQDYQSAFAVHEDKEYLHIHMALNNCPVFQDKPKLSCVLNLFGIQNRVEDMIDSYLGYCENILMKKWRVQY